ncbi:MAG: hypothetical protein Q4F05_10385 [bacterium]|nr:hypothetical protein [bacterium]
MNQNDNGQKVFRCQNCGRTISPSHMYCSACGAKNPWYGNDISKNMEQDDLPVINTDDIFGNLDYIDHKQEKKNKAEDDDLPVINTDGLFDDVPFADTTGYPNKTTSNHAANMQYYSMGTQQQEPYQGSPSQSMNANSKDMPNQGATHQDKVDPSTSYNMKNDMRNDVKDDMRSNQAAAQRSPYANPASNPNARGGQSVPPANTGNESHIQEENEEKPKKSKKKFVILGVLLMAAIAVGLTCFFVFGKSGKKTDLMDICGYKFEGVNGKGTVAFEFNENCDLYSDFFIQDNTEACEALKKITFTATPSNGLSNGDTVTIIADYSHVDLSTYGLKVSNDSKQVVVSGLPDATEYDVFKDVIVKFEGYEGSGKASIDVTGCDDFTVTNVKYSFQGASENLKNGDKVVVFAQVEASALEENNYEVGADTKEFTVEGLSDAKAFDVFKDITISYAGASPKLSLSVDKSSSDSFVKDKVTFELSKKEDVSIGDTITVTAKFNEEDAKSAGYKIDTLTKTVTVSNVPSYLSSITSGQASSLDSKIIGVMEDQEESNGDSYVFDRDLDQLFDDGRHYEFVKASKDKALRYFLYNDEKDEINSYILVEKYTITAEEEETGEVRETVIYAESTISNIILDDDGKTITHEEPSSIVTDTDLNYFINKVNGLGYKITSVK